MNITDENTIQNIEIKDLKINFSAKKDTEFIDIIQDLLDNQTVQQMHLYNHHSGTSCFDHCLHVSYYTYLFCKKFHFDYISATRGAMLHDLFLYDWHIEPRPDKNWKSYHAFRHPKVALQNATKLFNLNSKEQDIIVKHMWPVTISLPKYKESFVVTFADKFSALKEFTDSKSNLLHSKKAYKYAYVFLSLVIFRII